MLAFAVLAAAVGAAIDVVTSHISWEYFFYGKNLRAVLGAELPPDATALTLGAVRTGATSSWWVGVIVGLVLVVLNARPGGSSASALQLFRRSLNLLFTTLCGASIGTVAGWFRVIPMTAAVAEVAASDVMRPAHYVAVYGAHLGAYVGAAIGLVVVAISVRRSQVCRVRVRLTNATGQPATLSVEPWGDGGDFPAETTIELLMSGPVEGALLEIQSEPGALTIWGWSGSTGRIMRGGQQIRRFAVPVPPSPPGVTTHDALTAFGIAAPTTRQADGFVITEVWDGRRAVNAAKDPG